MSFADYLRDEGIKIGEKRGEKREREKNRFDTVKKLLLKTDMPAREIARVLEVSQYYIRKVKKKIENPVCH